ncbi:MAG: TolC family outer membrane protein [Xanthomonadales bacterium]|uniref:TolC family outer membrane protein n=1 Tax=Dokdonella sp. TaxID=2291710 RepID=UPI002C4B8C00|nr:TolC family outer membrane protein [Xanthomonadales bacterium]HQV73118.1 TolC family outer membrane protein [Dokdonella sp.]MBK7013922.1 TolC family outer membrane protein [Xanthomonadales bacterium]MBK7209969.1 TolC family outer membrane protein [Xanthomonadales bacterium]MBL0222627.1 TolC family outer membrane protein [Xanthomonadales bacterium]
MNAFRPLSLALALVLGTGASLARADDLIQIYGEARASDPQLAGAEATNQANSESVDQARSALLPQIGASLAYSQSHGSSGGPQFVTNEDGSQSLVNVTSSADNYSRTLSGRLDQSILDLSKWTALKSARATVKSSDATYEAAQQDLLIRVATAYFDVLTAEDALRFAQANEQALNRQMEQAQQRFDVGLSAITDVNDAKAQHDTAVASVITAQNTLDDNNEALRQLTNKEPGELKKLRDKLPLDKPNPENPESWVAVAVEQNPVLSSYAYSLEAANANIQTARSGHLPTINGQVLYSKSPRWSDTSASSFNDAFHTNSESWSTSVGLTLNVPIFSGGYTQSRVRQSIYTRDAAQDQFELQKRLIERSTRNSYRAVIAGASQVEATRQAVVSAQSSLDATQAGYEVGTRTIVDVLISQQQLLSAQSSYSQARHAFVLNGLRLKQAAGIIEVKDLEAVNALLE